ncbi:MAG: DUF3194 domain-containing protein [Candidatus Bathyarchaeia archaeon]
MEEIGIPELTEEQVETLCEIAEEAARNHILSKIPSRRISALDITVDIEGKKPITVNIEVNLELSPLMKGFDAETLVKEATNNALNSVESHLRDLACKFSK